jgi:cellobiose transport system permease protein
MTSMQSAPQTGLAPATARTAIRRPQVLGEGGLNYRRAGIGTYIFLGIMVLISIWPFYWMFVVGSNNIAAVNAYPPRVIPGGNFIDHARVVFERVPFGRNITNSFIVAGTIAASQVFFCTLAGFALSKLNFKGRNILFLIVIATLTVPVQLGVVPFYLIITELGWLNTLRALIIPGAVGAFGVFFMRQYTEHAIPDELLDAGRVDGASNWRLFRSVVLPIVRPGGVGGGVRGVGGGAPPPPPGRAGGAGG